ncbi:MAG: NAD(P)-dependent oxidoreductase [Firmicutes bacterium]|nr:NAD(P)-dependent oxidoreductase [Bacillota bacterium]
MKKVLVTGAAGSVGLLVIKYLLSEGKYEITALDLKNKKVSKKLKKYRKRINIIHGDVTDSVLMEALVRDHNIIIHLASVMPPLGEFSKKIGEIVDYNGTENIIKAINYYNKDCFLIYASTTSLYDSSLSGNIKEKVNEKNLTNYSLNKYNTEVLIKKKLKNYTILRLPLVLNNIIDESFIFNIKKNLLIEVTTNVDAAYAFVKAIDYQKELNKKIFNVGLGKEGRVIYNDILKNILKYQGISFRYILSRIFLEKDYRSPVLTDSDNLEELIHYRNDSLYNYYRRLQRGGKSRRIRKFLAKPLLYLKNKE